MGQPRNKPFGIGQISGRRSAGASKQDFSANNGVGNTIAARVVRAGPRWWSASHRRYYKAYTGEEVNGKCDEPFSGSHLHKQLVTTAQAFHLLDEAVKGTYSQTKKEVYTEVIDIDRAIKRLGNTALFTRRFKVVSDQETQTTEEGSVS